MEVRSRGLLRKLMRTILKLGMLLFTLGLGWQARAQGPVVAGIAPVFEGGVGYSYMRSDIPSEGTMGMNGVLLSGSGDFNRHWGIKLELGYSRNFDAFQSGHTADMVTYMGGPVFYPIRTRRYSIYAEALFGGARETGVNFEADGTLIRGFVNRFAWAGGGGLQYRISPALSLRGGVDYLRSSFFNDNALPTAHSNLRSSVSVVYTFGRHE